jgi:hypothetical protein
LTMTELYCPRSTASFAGAVYRQPSACIANG